MALCIDPFKCHSCAAQPRRRTVADAVVCFGVSRKFLTG